jgi:dTDP-4-amino-4,6-dideoxygalactose transaminase
LPRRERVWARYDEAFADLPCRTPAPAEPGSRHARHLYTLLIDTEATGRTRDEVLDQLTQRKIGAGVHYLPVHTHPYYMATHGFQRGDFPVTEEIGRRTVSLPMSAKLTEEDVEDVVEAVRAILR